MGDYYSIRNYEVHVDDQMFLVTKETAKCIEKATYECETRFSGWCSNLTECFSVACWLDEFIKQNTNENGMIENIDYKDEEAFKQIAESLKKANDLRIYKLRIRKIRNGITYADIRIEQGVDAEQILENKLLVDIFKDYLKDDGLRSKVISRVQGSLDLISEHLRYRQEERKKLEEKRQEIKAECRQKTEQSYNEYLKRCRNYSGQNNPPVLQEERGA